MRMVRWMCVSGWMFLLVQAYPGSPEQRAVKQVCAYVCVWLVETLCLQCFDAVGRSAEIWHLACKNWVVGCWCGYLYGARCRRAYGPGDATATHCLSGSPGKGAVSWCVYVLVLLGFGFFSTSQEIGWEERLRNDLFCVEWDVKPCSIPYHIGGWLKHCRSLLMSVGRGRCTISACGAAAAAGSTHPTTCSHMSDHSISSMCPELTLPVHC